MALEFFANPTPVPRGTLTELFYDAVENRSGVALASFVGETNTLDPLRYPDVLERVRAVADGLASLGVDARSRVAILSENRPEWALADYACLCARIEDVPIHSTLTAEQVAYILNDSEARLVFASDVGQMHKVFEASKDVTQELTVVVFDPPSELPDRVHAWAELLERGRALEGRLDAEAFRARALSAQPDDVATILYTSGTTGNPKGVMLTHDNLHSNVQASAMVLPAAEDDSTLSFLPLSHVFQRMVDYLHFWKGVSITYAHSVETVAQDIRTVQPTIVCAVPRLYEKVYAAIQSATGFKKKLVDWASGVGAEWTEVKLSGREPGGLLALRYRLAERLVFGKVRAAVGGRLRYFVSGSAPLSADINRFFYGMGLTVLEGYGLTETSPVTNVNTFEDFRIGTVGKPVPSTELRVAEDGEILVRGPQVMKGYFKLPEATAAVIDSDGWFSTGDIGEIDDDGFLRITDRKKDLLKTSGGKYVAPQQIENLAKLSDYVEQAVCVGDGRKFCAVLLVPDGAALVAWAKSIGLTEDSVPALIRRREVQEMIENDVFGRLHGLSRHEIPKKIGLVAEPFTIEDGTLTPTQKVKRRVVVERRAELIEAFYAEENVDQTVFVAE